ncbi:hypothetical protein [Aestuariivita boseongensis]|uniref:hypothetical protein n=1 Tax=Aestuariivita boseongensis TaxID=1470562 RepID=UPI00067FAD10|nr:hypothetical protein [Aestuariivita boseongensis]
MSEPVKSVEIEDVLSSIRRLVSEDHRQTPPREEEKPRAPDRLVLTDALRVTDPQPEESRAEEADEPLVLESPEAPQDDHGHSDQDENFAEQAEMPHDAADSVEDAAHAQDWQPEDDTAQADEAAETETAQTVTDDAPWSDPEATLYEAAGLAEDAQPEEDADMRPLGEKIAALEEVIARTDDQWEPDGTGTDDYAGTEVETLEWEDAEADDTLEAAPVAEDEPETAEDPSDSPDETVSDALLDEAALRDLVADIVREELQGALGERITRNVRKLVRREIHRALALKDLD